MTADTRVHSESWAGRILPESHPSLINQGAAPLSILSAGAALWAISWIASHGLIIIGGVILIAVVAALSERH